MIKQLFTDVYRSLRESTGLSQRQLAAAAALPRSAIQRIESGDKLPSPAEESAIREATACSRLFFAELVCKALSPRLGCRITILPDAPGNYRPATPIGEAGELLQGAQGVMPEERWWSLMEQLGRIKTRQLLLEQDCFGFVRHLKTELWELERKHEGSNGEPEES